VRKELVGKGERNSIEQRAEIESQQKTVGDPSVILKGKERKEGRRKPRKEEVTKGVKGKKKNKKITRKQNRKMGIIRRPITLGGQERRTAINKRGDKRGR